jgi:hypothetical protein
MRPSINQDEDQLGFFWRSEQGRPITLPDLILLDDEPERLPPTHLSAMDDALIDLAGRFGEFLGGGRMVETVEEQASLRELHRVLDRLTHEYAAALGALDLPVEIRAGQIVGTAQLFAIRARMALGMAGPSPLAGTLADPSIGVLAGRGQLHTVDPQVAWRGSRWVVQTDEGPQYPLTLSMLLFDSSGVNKEAAVDEHRAALRATTNAAAAADADPLVAAGAIEWLLYDWLMAHRESPSSAEITIAQNRVEDAEMIVAASAAAARARALLDPAMFALPSR